MLAESGRVYRFFAKNVAALIILTGLLINSLCLLQGAENRIG